MSGHLPTHAPVLLPYGSGSLSLFFVKAFLVNCFISDPHHHIDCLEELVSSFYDNRHACYRYDEAFESCMRGPPSCWLRSCGTRGCP